LYKYFGAQYWWPGNSSFEIIIGAILTQNTNWNNVEKAINNLKKENKLNVSSLNRISTQRLAKLIRPVGYYNIKTKRLKNFISFLYSRYNGELNKLFCKRITVLRKELLEIKGIGQETADSILLYAFNKPVFVIDAYTRRILERHNFVKNNTTYDEMQKLFMINLPRKSKLYNEYHALLVKLGKDYCRKKPNCNKCPLNWM